ncbi:nitrogen fixation protein NifQ [Paraburkholderia dipogonis]|uniref:nitrogen fixation protein NifQ n=1 Tax=Paraburkholderia dipogonis TaxID=1211383 RepID=UPI0038BD5797
MTHWLDAATDAASPDTQLVAKLIAERDARNELALLGLEQPKWRALLARHFARAAVPATLPFAVTSSEHAEFVRTLHALLLTHASAAIHADDAHCLASIIAHACLRPDHLWRDLGLAGRDEVTWMLTRYFPTLVALNTANLRWKKFLAEQRALSLGLQPGPAPGCPGCEDYGHCFPELHRGLQ